MNTGTPRSAHCPQLGERQGTDTPSEPPEGTTFGNTLILDFQPLAWQENTLLLSSAFPTATAFIRQRTLSQR